MKKHGFEIVLWVYTVILCCLVFLFPDTVPIHWDSNWQVNGYGSRYTLFLLALIPDLIYYGMLVTKKIDPNSMKLEKHANVYMFFRKMLTIFFMILAGFFYYLTAYPQTNGEAFMAVIMGALFIMIGNYLPQLPKNYFLGIRTPWTLANENVWIKTHRVGGYAFVGCGMLTILFGFIGQSLYVMLVCVIIASLFVFIYSYLLYKKEGH